MMTNLVCELGLSRHSFLATCYLLFSPCQQTCKSLNIEAKKRARSRAFELEICYNSVWFELNEERFFSVQ